MELEEVFDFKKIQKGGAIFNIQKLDWFNAYYLKELSKKDIEDLLADFTPASWRAKECFSRAVELERERMKTLRDFQGLAGFFFEFSEYPTERLIWKHSNPKDAKRHIETILGIMEETLHDGLERRVMEYAEEEGRGDVLWPLRVALSGLEKSPGPFLIISVIGREEAIGRVRYALSKLK